MFVKNILKNIQTNINRGSGKIAPNPEFDRLLTQLVFEVKGVTNLFFFQVPVAECPIYEQIKLLKPKEKAHLVFYLAHRVAALRHKVSHKKYSSEDEDYIFQATFDSLLSSLLRMKLEFEEEGNLIALFELFHQNSSNKSYHLQFHTWPVGFTVAQFEKHVKQNGLSNIMRDFIKETLSWPKFDESSNRYGSDIQKAKHKLHSLIYSVDNGSGVVPPYRLKEDDVLGKYINDNVDKLDGGLRERVYEIFNLALTADRAVPTNKFLEASKAIMSSSNTTRYKSCIHDWLTFLISAQPIEQTHTSHYSTGDYTWVEYIFLSEKNKTLIKGLIWSLCQFHDEATVDLIAKLTERCFKKIPGKGPTCAEIGNACIYYLANSRGTRGISHLSRLKLKITQNSTRELISAYINEESRKRGVSSAELEEQAVPDFGLEAGILKEQFGDYMLKVSLTGIGKTELQWFIEEGKLQKSTPAFVINNKKHRDRLQKIKSTAKQIQKYSTAQRDRIDWSYIDMREWSYNDFLKYYLNHGLVSSIATRLIWVFDLNGVSVSAIWRNGRWEDVEGGEVIGIRESTRVRLWHPLLVDTKEVIKWRNRLQHLEIQQPMKQAHREVYILTDAELETRTYSNRMAAHLLKQHQFNALAAIRGWKYSLQGAFDDGRNAQPARVHLPAHNITCEFWINELYSDHAFNQAGIWDYVSSDQVRFVDQNGQAMNLINVPRLVFSEMMRDVDLFVGVCSVGNDPQWLDRGGLTEYRDYWTEYSFGDLTEVAKTRKSVLEQLLPRLKIRNQAIIDGKFLRIKGKIREYKVHIGSTNILMEPNDQYLCIVPTRASEQLLNKVFLPFEGDRGLSIILSKAILLAEDDKIKDTTILNQILRKS